MAGSAANPFYVAPMRGADIGGSFMQGMQMKQARDATQAAEQAAARKNEAQTAYQNATTDAERLAVLRNYPEMADAIDQQTTFINEQTKANHRATYGGIAKAATVEDAIRLQQERVKYLRDMGQDYTESEQDLLRMQSGEMTLDEIRDMANLERMGHEEERQAMLDEKELNAPPAFNSTLGKLQADRDLIASRYGEGDPRLAAFDRKIAEEAGLTQAQVQQIDPVLLRNLDETTARQASAAYSAVINSGGDAKDALKAYESAVEYGTGRAEMNALPDNIRTAFPKATPKELAEMQAVAAAAGDAKAGMEAAKTLRGEQRQQKKGVETQNAAIALVEEIAAIPDSELGDVLGSFEGDPDSWLAGALRTDDTEYDTINKIDQLAAILTAENLDLLKGTMSDADIAMLRQISAGGLNRQQSEKSFRENLEKVRGALQRAAASRPRRLNIPPRKIP